MRKIYQTEDLPEILAKKEKVINAMTARLEELKEVEIMACDTCKRMMCPECLRRHLPCRISPERW